MRLKIKPASFGEIAKPFPGDFDFVGSLALSAVEWVNDIISYHEVVTAENWIARYLRAHVRASRVLGFGALAERCEMNRISFAPRNLA
jgi:hypothetical protein